MINFAIKIIDIIIKYNQKDKQIAPMSMVKKIGFSVPMMLLAMHGLKTIKAAGILTECLIRGTENDSV